VKALVGLGVQIVTIIHPLPVVTPVAVVAVQAGLLGLLAPMGLGAYTAVLEVIMVAREQRARFAFSGPEAHVLIPQQIRGTYSEAFYTH
jgi:hypothetical protein